MTDELRHLLRGKTKRFWTSVTRIFDIDAGDASTHWISGIFDSFLLHHPFPAGVQAFLSICTGRDHPTHHFAFTLAPPLIPFSLPSALPPRRHLSRVEPCPAHCKISSSTMMRRRRARFAWKSSTSQTRVFDHVLVATRYREGDGRFPKELH